MDTGIFLHGLCRLPEGSSLVTDADEEVFLLYTDLAGKRTDTTKEFRGLGYLDNHKDVLTLEFIFPKPAQEATKSKKKSKKMSEPVLETLEVQLAQDQSALRSRKGDTGSVLWRASADFAQLILQQCHLVDPNTFFDSKQLADANVLELGAGTGLLGVVFAPLVQQYTVTDIQELIPLITKNLRLNNVLSATNSPQRKRDSSRANVAAEALDWVSLHNASPNTRRSTYSYPPIDLLLVIDCIYHPSLLPALVDTIDHLATPDRTTVVVIVELRAEDVVREFLELWLGAGGGVWEIWHAREVMKGPYAVWVGRKKASGT